MLKPWRDNWLCVIFKICSLVLKYDPCLPSYCLCSDFLKPSAVGYQVSLLLLKSSSTETLVF